jgi:hypothetical protein
LCIEEDKIVVKNNLNYNDIKAVQKIFGEEKRLFFKKEIISTLFVRKI